ncbi:hypothetical protein M422DRAFT_23649 [Sphaerobolus stellatus SS14]|nr:hypothetical protein M422DRAFT_23649 [Sphaerobolus stellatus SS14]
MRQVRVFSTALKRCRQALYEPYIQPLNEEEKKALRKEMTKYEPTLHGRMLKDIEMTLKMHDPSKKLLRERENTVKHVQLIIQNAYGPQYSIVDMSLGQYARDIAVAPLELAIIDQQRPEGFLPGTETEPLPGPYDHMNLAKTLLASGFTGTFIDGDAVRMQLERDDPEKFDTMELGPAVWRPSWNTDYIPFKTTYLRYPPVLDVCSPNEVTLPFLLRPPMPTNVHLLQLFKEYFSDRIFKSYLSIIYLWAKSVELEPVSTQCLTLMAISVMQGRRLVPNLQDIALVGSNNTLERGCKGVWIRGEYPPIHPRRSFWVETMFTPISGNFILPEPKRLKRLIYSFFDAFATHSVTHPFLPAFKAISIQNGGSTDRDTSISRLKSGMALAQLQNAERSIERGRTPWNPLAQPAEWITQPLIVMDPFISSFNHARNMTSHHVTYFSHFCSVSRRILGRSRPLSEIFGPHINMPKRHYSINAMGRAAQREYEVMSPPPSIFPARAATIARVESALRNRFGQDYRVLPFGSTQYNVSTASSDIDLVVLDPDRRQGFTPKNAKDLPEIYDTKAIGRALFKKGFTNVIAITGANVPIVKFHDPRTGLDCDINVNDRLGLTNTLLIRRYCNLVPYLRPMIMTIKSWAKPLGLNNPSGQHGPSTFSSYALAIMAIGYLQIEGVLPNLQAGLHPLPKKVKDGVFWIRAKKGAQDYVRCDIRMNENPTGWVPKKELSLGEALYGWFRFWAEEFPYDTHLLSIRHGGLVKREVVTIPAAVKKKLKRGVEAFSDPEEYHALMLQKQKLNTSSSLDREERELQQAEEQEEIALAALYEMKKEMQQEEAEREENVEGEGEPIENVTISAEAEEEPIKAVKISAESEQDVEPFVSVRDFTATLSDQGIDVDSDAESVTSTFMRGEEEEQQPTQWTGKRLVISDPFIRAKNLGTNIGKAQLDLFQQECHRAAFIMQAGDSLSDLISTYDEVLSDEEIVAQGRGRGTLGLKRGKQRMKVTHGRGRDTPLIGNKRPGTGKGNFYGPDGISPPRPPRRGHHSQASGSRQAISQEHQDEAVAGPSRGEASMRRGGSGRRGGASHMGRERHVPQEHAVASTSAVKQQQTHTGSQAPRASSSQVQLEGEQQERKPRRNHNRPPPWIRRRQQQQTETPDMVGPSAMDPPPPQPPPAL